MAHVELAVDSGSDASDVVVAFPYDDNESARSVLRRVLESEPRIATVTLARAK